MGAFILLGLLASAAAYAAFDMFSNDDTEKPSDDQPNPDGDGDDDLLDKVGTAGGDRVTLSDSLMGNAEIYRGLAGNDTIDAGSTNDLSAIYGGNGDDRIDVPFFNDQNISIYGDAGNDDVSNASQGYGGSGDDALSGDTLFGDNGNDTLAGWAIYGGNGNDILWSRRTTISNPESGAYGGHGNDTILIPSNRFTIDGESRTYLGGEGNDSFIVGTETVVELTDFDPKEDRICIYLTDPEIYGSFADVRPDIQITEDQSDTIVNIEWPGLYKSVVTLKGTTGLTLSDIDFVREPTGNGADPEILERNIGTDSSDRWVDADGFYYFGGEGNDTIETSDSGVVMADLGSGDDTFISNGAEIFVNGGNGDDTYIENAGSTAVNIYLENEPYWYRPAFKGESGNDTIILKSVNSGTYNGGDGDDLIRVEVGGVHALVFGGEGNDTIIAESGIDVFAGSDKGDNITLNISAEDLIQPFPRSSIYDFDIALPGSIIVNLDKALEGPLTIVQDGNYTSEGLTGSYRSVVYRGDTRLFIIHGNEEDPLISIDDPRLVINYA